MPKKSPPLERGNIIALTGILRKYQPLVNEKDPWVLKDGETGPTVDELLLAIGKAMMDITGFIRSYEEVKKQYADLYADAMHAHGELSRSGLNVQSLGEGFEKLVGRHRQALDVLRFISVFDHMCNYEIAFNKSREAAQAYLDNIKKKNEAESHPAISLVNETLNGHTGDIPEAVPPDEPDSGSSPEEDEPRS